MAAPASSADQRTADPDRVHRVRRSDGDSLHHHRHSARLCAPPNHCSENIPERRRSPAVSRQRLMSRDLFFRGRPGKRVVDPRRVPRQVSLAAAVGVHDVDVVVAVALAREGDLLPVWRPERLPPALGQPP